MPDGCFRSQCVWMVARRRITSPAAPAPVRTAGWSISRLASSNLQGEWSQSASSIFYMFSSTQCSSALNCCRVEDGATMSRPACNGSARGWGRPRRWPRRLPSPESSVIRRMTTQVLNFCGSWPMENLLSLYCYTAVSSSFYSNSGHLDL